MNIEEGRKQIFIQHQDHPVFRGLSPEKAKLLSDTIFDRICMIYPVLEPTSQQWHAINFDYEDMLATTSNVLDVLRSD